MRVGPFSSQKRPWRDDRRGLRVSGRSAIEALRAQHRVPGAMLGSGTRCTIFGHSHFPLACTTKCYTFRSMWFEPKLTGYQLV